MVSLLSDVFDGKIEYLQIIDEEGNADQSLFPKDLDDKKLIEMYKYMCFARAFDAKALSLQRQGRIVTYAPLVGEEATQIGSAFAMRKDDYFVPNFRQHGVFLARGLPLEMFIIGWRGFEEGSKAPEGFRSLAVAVPVATQMQHSVGLAYALKYKKLDSAVVAYVGDGGTSEGDFYEATNFSGELKVPLVMVIENNQWAISVPRSKQSIAKTLAQKAFAAGIPGMQVDGNDVVAVYKAVSDAINNAKDNGPMLIECVTYRMSLHTTADDPTKYRNPAEVDLWKKKDPILRIKTYLTKKNLWNDQLEKQMGDEQSKMIDDAVAKGEAFKGDPRSMFENLYSFMPDVLKEEMDEAEAAKYWQ